VPRYQPVRAYSRFETEPRHPDPRRDKLRGLITVKKSVSKMLLTVAAVPAMIVAAAGSASAASSGNVTWKGGWSGQWLCSQVDYGPVTTCWNQSAQGVPWTDRQNSDGSWNEVDQWGRCLTGYWTSVYVESCNSASNGTNNWERWNEISTATGWKLKNVQTGYILDEDNNYHVYANATDYGNSDAHQRWH
jgi:hypothetical protein